MKHNMTTSTSYRNMTRHSPTGLALNSQNYSYQYNPNTTSRSSYRTDIGNNVASTIKKFENRAPACPPRAVVISRTQQIPGRNEFEQVITIPNTIKSVSNISRADLSRQQPSRSLSSHRHSSSDCLSSLASHHPRGSSVNRGNIGERCHHSSTLPKTYTTYIKPSVTNNSPKLPDINQSNRSRKSEPDDDRARRKKDVLFNGETDERIHRRSDSVSSDREKNIRKISHGKSMDKLSLSPDKNSDKFECGLSGLRNLGNTCFMNSVLQCLSNTRPLLKYVLDSEYLGHVNKSTSSMKGALINSYAKLMSQLWSSESCVVLPTDFKSQIARFASRFMGYSQQDAQEFLVYLLEGLHEDVNRVTVKKKPVMVDEAYEEKLCSQEKAMRRWMRYIDRENSRILELFVGMLKSSLQCTSCGYISETFDPFWDLSLPIKQSKCHLIDCLTLFTQKEELSGDEKPTCAKCKQRRKCTKSLQIQQFPQILILVLKRFSHSGYSRSKLNSFVNFDLDNLDLSRFAAEKGTPVVYSLYAVANHTGSASFGHYTGYAKHPYSGCWHHFNDSSVSSLSNSDIVSNEAYVLFYELSTQSSRL